MNDTCCKFIRCVQITCHHYSNKLLFLCGVRTKLGHVPHTLLEAYQTLYNKVTVVVCVCIY